MVSETPRVSLMELPTVSNPDLRIEEQAVRAVLAYLNNPASGVDASLYSRIAGAFFKFGPEQAQLSDLEVTVRGGMVVGYLLAKGYIGNYKPPQPPGSGTPGKTPSQR